LIYCQKSKIHGVGVFAAQIIPKGAYIAQYCGVVIRNTLIDRRETFYRSKGFGSYMFKVDRDYAIGSGNFF